MKNMMTVCALFGAALAFPLAANAETLEEAFRNPPPATRPHVWWHWMGANVTEQGIRRDLQAMADAGIGGATVFNVRTHVNCGPTMENAANDKFAYRNDEYWRLLKVAAEEAPRLGLELLLHNCPGFSVSGGPWIMPDLSMKNLAWKTGDDPATLANPWTQSPSGVLGTWLVTNDEGRVTWYRGGVGLHAVGAQAPAGRPGRTRPGGGQAVGEGDGRPRRQRDRAAEGAARRALRRLPDFVLGQGERPSSGRVGFTVWDYLGVNTPLLPSGLIGPVTVEIGR